MLEQGTYELPNAEKDTLKMSRTLYLYRIEARYRKRKFTSEQRMGMRQQVSRLVYEALLDWINYEQRNNLTKGDIAKALLYAKTHLGTSI
ncbi:MAG: transposase [Lewinella sp.]|nr:transposase [Lewinella sp.]